MKAKIYQDLKIWGVALAIAAGIVAIGLNSIRIIERNTASAFNRQQLFLAREAARGIEELIGSIKGNLTIAADVASSRSNDFTVMETVFRSIFLAKKSYMLSMFFATADGKILCRYPKNSLGFDTTLELKKLFAAEGGINKHFLSRVVHADDVHSSGLALFLGVPVTRDGAVRAQWVCCIADFRAIKNEFVYPIRSGKTGYAWMIDDKGMLLAHPNAKMEGKKAIDVLRELLPNSPSLKLEEIIKNEMHYSREGQGEYIGWHRGEHGVTRKLIAYTPIRIGETGWSIAVAAPYHEVIEPLKGTTNGVTVFLGCFVAIILIGAFWIDRQERRKMQVYQYLQWSQEVFNGITDGISIIDRNYKVLMVNEAVCRWQDRPINYFLGKPCHEVFLQRDELCLGCPARETFETGQPSFRERVSLTVGGKKYYFHLYTFPLKDRNNKTVRVVEYVKDVTKERMLQSEIIQNERLAIIGRMSAQVAHEIRNPLGALTLNIDLLEDEISDYHGVNTKEAVSLIATIRSELESLRSVIEEYLQFARLPKMKPGKVDVNRILEEIFSFMEEQFKKNNITVKKVLQHDLPPARLDQSQMRRVFINVMKNAIEAIKNRGQIDITTRFIDGFIEVIIMDSGEGIPEENLEQIFTPFFSTKDGGTGLGLAIARHIVAEHQGEIFCESRLHEGTRFKIRIPKWENS